MFRTGAEDVVQVGQFLKMGARLQGVFGGLGDKDGLTTAIIEHLKSHYHITITAPTHKALSVIVRNIHENNIIGVSAKTIHSFLGIKLFTDYDKGMQKFVPDKTKKNLDTTDILIVDESSMISDELFEFITQAVEQERVKAVLFVGDYYQLLPVDTQKNGLFSVRHHYKLHEIVRQAKDSYIIKIATAAREIIKNKSYMDLKTFFKDNMDINISFFHNQEDFVNDFYQKENWSIQDQVITSFRNADVDAYNRLARKRHWQDKGREDELPTLLAGDKIVFQSAYSINGVLKYSNNQEIMLSSAEQKFSNALEIAYWECQDADGLNYNEIVRIVDPESAVVFNDKLKKIATTARKERNHVTRKKMWENYFALKELFADVKYTFASTIHKLQGSTYETVYIDLFGLSNSSSMDKDQLYRLVYVAITRASKDIKILIPALSNVSIESIEDDFLHLFTDVNF